MTHGIEAAQPHWFYDFVSPFSYLLLEQHDKWPTLAFNATPIELDTLYRHWGGRAAYSLPTKRIFTYRHALFRAEQLGIPFRMPPVHPFDSRAAMQLALATNADIQGVREIFRFIWREGRDPSTAEGFASLCERLGQNGDVLQAANATAQAQLQRNTAEAIALGVFGVPTFYLDGQLFWGEDALPMVLYCARTPNWLESKEVQRVSALPSAVKPD
ncbi:2-hydroxychromene-2-carboxylate isomerase [Paraburkholderia hayleyella]|uniref:2-hydroxychromene-2-carboxylate isomerase n=1 Tax=Paraburkholderia hayleyella TaxID=2152889 RepID=UPI001290E48B|nr:2-hydroxychromene-2-carboxylate isomerase [Paraburkholderia hayleyella]